MRYMHLCQELPPCLLSPAAPKKSPYPAEEMHGRSEWESRGVVRDERGEIRSSAAENESGCELLSTCPLFIDFSLAIKVLLSDSPLLFSFPLLPGL